MSKVAIIIPFYNQTLEYISQAVDSALTQTLRDIEVILVDDGSANPLQYRKLTKDSRVKIFQSPHRGAGYARNIGILNSNSENIMFLDSDDYYPTNTVLENLYTLKNEHKVLITGGRFFELQENGILNETAWDKDSFKNCIVNYVDYQQRYFFWRFFYDSNFIKQNNLFFPQLIWYEDPVWFVKALHKAQCFYGADMVSYIHRTGKTFAHMSTLQATHYFRGCLTVLKYAKRNKLQRLYNEKKNEFFNYELPQLRKVPGIKPTDIEEMIKLFNLIDTTKLI